MKITDLNSDGGIGANSLFIEIGPYRILVDAGLHPKKAGLGALPQFHLIEDRPLDFIILTHCHLDHLGGLPVVAGQHPEATLLCSRPSAVIAPRMLHNSISVMKKQRDELNIREYPLFSRADIDALEDRFTPVPYESPIQFQEKGDRISFTFYHAGHVAGACGLQIEYRDKRYLITGDVLFTLQRTLDGAQLPTLNVDTLIMETTRGATERDPDRHRDSEVEALLDLINNVIDRGGSILLPVFALGRMQEVMKILYEARQANRIPKVPIFASGLGMSLVDYFDAISRKTGLVNFQRNIIQKMGVREPNWQFKPGRGVSEQGIFVLSSGMLVEKTPSYKAAAAMLEDSHNAIAFCGYCDPDTPGGKILAHQPGDPFVFEALDYQGTIKAEIVQFDLSGHADREELMEFALAIQPRVLVLTHGDLEARKWFSDSIQKCEAQIQLVDPEPLKAYDLS